MLQLNRTIAYAESWKATLSIAMIIGFSLSFILIFLQPFDTAEADIPYKNLKLIGYTLCVVIPIMLFHPIENAIYKKQGNRWFIINELLYISSCLFVIITFSYLYNTFIVNGLKEATKDNWLFFMKYFGLPFAPLLGPLWIYFRSRFGTIELPEGHAEAKKINIRGDNKSEYLSIQYANFLYAQAQQNYVCINYLENSEIKKFMIRSTLSKLFQQIPDAWQVHRSYLVNIDHLKSVDGNARKRIMTFYQLKDPIPVSQKYYDALKNKLSNSSH